MRTVEQIVNDLTKAAADTAKAKQTEQRFRDELKEVHNYLSDLLKPAQVTREIDFGEGNRG